MQIQINTKDNISRTDKLVEHVEAQVDAALSNFADRITRVEVYLSDINSDEKSGVDKRCLMEVRLAGKQPMVANDEAETVELAVIGAAEKLGRVVSKTLEREGEHKGNVSFSGE